MPRTYWYSWNTQNLNARKQFDNRVCAYDTVARNILMAEYNKKGGLQGIEKPWKLYLFDAPGKHATVIAVFECEVEKISRYRAKLVSSTLGYGV